MKQVRVEDLIGQEVRDASGQSIGRIHDLRAEERNGALVVVEYHVGTGAITERLGLSLRKIAGVHAEPELKKIPWDRLDISDPSRPKLVGE